MDYVLGDDAKSFEKAVIGLIPAMRSFARTFVRSRSDIDDLVQETLARAWLYRASFSQGSNLKSWLYKILQNCFYADARRNRGLVNDPDGYWANQQTIPAAQEWSLQYGEVMTAMQQLPADSRDALIMIVEEGRSYEEAAEIADCSIGTFKSRVKRARDRLNEGYTC